MHSVPVQDAEISYGMEKARGGGESSETGSGAEQARAGREGQATVDGRLLWTERYRHEGRRQVFLRPEHLQMANALLIPRTEGDVRNDTVTEVNGHKDDDPEGGTDTVESMLKDRPGNIRKSLRSRDKVPCMNENLLIDLQRQRQEEAFLAEQDRRKRTRKRIIRCRRSSKTTQVSASSKNKGHGDLQNVAEYSGDREIDVDRPPPTRLRRSGRVADWDD
jgi:hypothetical protein